MKYLTIVIVLLLTGCTVEVNENTHKFIEENYCKENGGIKNFTVSKKFFITILKTIECNDKAVYDINKSEMKIKKPMQSTEDVIDD